MHPEENLSKSSFVDKKYWEHTKEWLEVEIKFLKEIYGNNNIGIITLKDLGKYSKAFGYNVEYYNNLRGTNTLKDKLILILLGSFLPIVASWDARKEENKKEKYFDYLLSEYFFLKVDKNNLESIGIQAPKSIVEMYDYSLGKTYSYMYTGDAGKMLGTDGDEIAKKPAEALVTLLWYDEIYQAFHRNRPLNQPRIVFSYCWFPEPNALIYSVDKKKISNNIIGELSLFNHDLRDDFGDIEKVKGRSNELKEFFDKLRTLKYGKGGIIEDIVTEILQNPEITSKILTKKWHVNKPEGGEDTKTITELISAIRKLQNEAKRVEAK